MKYVLSVHSDIGIFLRLKYIVVLTLFLILPCQNIKSLLVVIVTIKIPFKLTITIFFEIILNNISISATQIGEVAQNIGQHLNLNVMTLVGGRTKQKMLNPPIEYCDMLVTTLGAYSKLVTTGIFKVHNVHHLVLDEADTLLDDSFIEKLSLLLRKFAVSIIA